MARTPTWQLIAVLWLVPATAAAAQATPAPRWMDAAAPEIAAFTVCADGRPVTFVNAGVIGTDSIAEIMAHERRHREQLGERRTCTRAAEREPMAVLLADEIDGYCASLPHAEERGIPRGERIGQYAGRLFRQFGGMVPLGQIAARLEECAGIP